MSTRYATESGFHRRLVCRRWRMTKQLFPFSYGSRWGSGDVCLTPFRKQTIQCVNYFTSTESAAIMIVNLEINWNLLSIKSREITGRSVILPVLFLYYLSTGEGRRHRCWLTHLRAAWNRRWWKIFLTPSMQQQRTSLKNVVYLKYGRWLWRFFSTVAIILFCTHHLWSSKNRNRDL